MCHWCYCALVLGWSHSCDCWRAIEAKPAAVEATEENPIDDVSLKACNEVHCYAKIDNLCVKQSLWYSPV